MLYRLATIHQNKLRLSFSYDPGLIAQIKISIPGRAWNPTEKAWYIPLEVRNVNKLRELKFDLDPSVEEWVTSLEKKKITAAKDIPNIPAGLKNKLFPFQAEDVRQIDRFDGLALIANDPGTGKTIETLAWLLIHPELRPVIVISPAKAKLNWKKHAGHWLPDDDIVTLSGRSEREICAAIKGHPRAIILTNYESLFIPASKKDKTPNRLLTEPLLNMNVQAVIIDEVHYIANTKAHRSKAVRQIAKKTKKILALSGTPATSRPMQYFPILNLLRPGLFPSFFHFAMKYCDAKQGAYGWDFSGASNTKELHDLLCATLMIRHRKEDVLPDLPEKLTDVLPLEIDNAGDYKAAEDDFIGWLEGQGENEKAERAARAETLTKIEGLKLLAARGKLASIKQWVTDFLNDSEEKLVIFTQHTEIRDVLFNFYCAEGVSCVKAVGGTQTFKAAEEFQNNKSVRLFIANIDAAGDSIDLFAASHSLFVELPQTPGKLKQAGDRLHRIGQRSCVNENYAMAEGTIDEDVAAMLDRKNKVLTAVADGKDIDGDSLITELIQRIRRRRK